MSSQQSTVDFLTEQMSDAGVIRSRKMFGEYAIYCGTKVIAFVCDDELFIKPTPVGYTFLDASHEAPPYPGAKNYLKVPTDRWDDSEWLGELVVKTAASLPEPKPKKSKKK